MFPRRIVAATIVLASCVPTHGSAPSFDTWADAFAAEWMRANPQFATSARYFSGEEQDRLDRQLTRVTLAARAERIERARRGLKELAAFDRASLSETQRVSADSLEWQLQMVVESEPFADHDFVFHQFRGLHASLIDFLTQRHPIRHARDIDNYLARLGQVPVTMDDGIARAEDQAARGFVPPKFILTATLAQFDQFLASDPGDNVLISSLRDRMAKLTEIPLADQTAFAERAAHLVGEDILPVYRRARDMLARHREQATDDAGLWRLPGGDAAYGYVLQYYTTTRLSPDEIHEIGLAEVARIESDMDVLLRQLGYDAGSVEERFQRLDASLQPTEDDPRPRLLADYTRCVRDAEMRAAELFDLRPKAPLEIRREPEMTEKTASASYAAPAPDGSRPGVFWVPLPGPTYRMARMRTLAYHEAVPGHHFQIALQQEMTDLPRFRRDRVFGGMAAHAEGWALYAEKLAVEAGWYEGDTIGLLGQLHSELFRARRLVVDTGLHARRWTRQQAIDYGILPQEVDRYVVYAGQACSYKIGMLRILELRARARDALGERFSLRRFHDVVLRTGSVPLDVLDDVIERAIASGFGSASSAQP